MSEELLVRNCAPTLAGLKTASLFNCPYESREELLSSLRQLNRRLGPKGVRAIPLRFSEKRALVYLYRPARLEQDLSANASAALLRQCGYTSCQSGKCLTSLARKLRQRGEFPHEIGVFLGYPVEDVIGFMENKGKNYVLCKYWKVYHHAERAKYTFESYDRCRAFLCNQLNQGYDLYQALKIS